MKMKMDFLTYFKGRTSKLNKREGLNGVLRSNCIPIEKAPGSNSFDQNSSIINYSDVERQSHNSNDINVIHNNPQIITNIAVLKKTRKLSQVSPLKQNNKLYNFLQSHNQQFQFPLSKTGAVNLNDYQIIAIPKSVVQYGFKLKQNDQVQPEQRASSMIRRREINSRSSSLDCKFQKPLNKSEIISSRQDGSSRQKRRFIAAGLNSIQ